MDEKLTQLLLSAGRRLGGAALLLLLPLLGWGQASPLVISQLYGGGGNSGAPLKYDYVELFNRSAGPVSLGSYSLAYFTASSTAATGTTYALATAVVPAGGYYLVQLAGGTNGADLPRADQTITSIAMSATAGRLDLLAAGALADRVGYGSTAATYKGSGAAPAPSATTALFRVLGGCTDVGNNATDFVTGAPAPRNAGAAGNLCNGPAPTITGFTPASGPVGASVSISGTGFTSSTAVTFNGTAATVVTFVSPTTLTAVVPGSATSGPVAVTTATGTAASATDFTVTVPVITASPATLTGLVATQGAASAAQSYQVSGSSLDGTTLLIKPSNASFEVSLNGLSYGATASLALSGSATLAPTPVYVRVASGLAVGALAGSIANTNGPTTTSVAVSGAVVAPLAPRRWTGAASTTSWFDAANWEGGTTPGPGDDVVLDHRYVGGKYTVVLGNSPGTAAATVASLRLRPLGGDSILLSIPNTNLLPATTGDSPALTLTRSLSGDTALYVGNRAFFTNASGAPAGMSNAVLEVAGTNPTVFLLNGGSYRHQTVRSVASLVENLSAGSGTETGNFYYRVPQASYTTITAGRTYGNLIFQRGSTNAGVSSYTTSGNSPLTINGSLTIENNVAFAAALLANIVLRGNLQNTGNFRFAPNNTGTTARLILQGTAPQLITGTALSDPGAGTDSYLSAAVQLEIANPAGATLRTPVAVGNTLVLTSGLLTTDAASPLTLAATATVQGGTDASFVNGPVRRPIGPVSSATAFVFPVGKGAAYRPLTLTISTQTSTTVYRAEQFEGNAARTLASPDPSGTSLTRVSRARYFTLTPFSPDAMPVVTQPLGFAGTVTLSYGADDGVSTPAATSLAVAKRADATQPWANAGRRGYAGTASAGTVTSDNILSFSDFALGSTDPAATPNPLPVQLAAFTAARQPGGPVALAWVTASEVNSARFELERSPDGHTFALLATVPAQGTSAIAHTYARRDEGAPAGPLYYRLRLVDADGTAAYSPVAVVAGSAPDGLLLAPNPAHDYLHFQAMLPTAYTVRSVLGQALLSGTVPSGPATVGVAGLPAGMYFLELRTPTERVVQRFAKE
ncbi:lamin tail domain-containing protein [Hymenobacter cheonanensis]|uniref:lamin tail domain-containing protein n=1 Tax=Hymenobacter sp. CA2-7 TaxID=3063993 RepID=UPI002713D6CC|nr:lamin tail domain-containing protein [Hymenobacter sp. CA2-7]MDO7886548.1 lamin tail domain-containing protein [Hymenobacter sp. CA2-7]